MSWFCGCFGKYSSELLNKINTFANSSSKAIIAENKYILIGQKDKNIFYNNNNPDFGFCISGVGLALQDKGYSLLDSEKWFDYAKRIENIKLPDGHYCGVIWNNNKLIFFNDILEVKKLYFVEENETIIFSNKLNIISKLSSKQDFNYQELAAAWYLNFKTNSIPLIKNLNTVSGRLIYQDGKLEKTLSHKLRPNFKSTAETNEFDNVLEKIALTYLNSNKKLSLGLTGGLDSRLLLSYLLKETKGEWAVHTFGNNKLPDIIYSKNITDTFNIKHKIYNYEIPKVEKLVEDFTNNAAYTNVTIPISEMIQFSMHEHFSDSTILGMDGSYGELYRRQMFNRLAIAGRKEILDKRIDSMLKFFLSSRPNIFNNDFFNVKNLELSIAEMFTMLPNPKDIGVENWLDLMSMVVKLPNSTAFSQQRLDDICTTFTAFIQPNLINIGLRIPLKKRLKARLFRKIIKKNEPQLTRFPLVKNHSSYPFWMSNRTAWVLTKVKSKITKPFILDLNTVVLSKLKDYTLDKLNSSSFINEPIYNKELIKTAVFDYYNGNNQKAQIVEWFLTFEFWKENFRK